MSTVCLLGSPRRHCNSDVLAQRFMQQAAVIGAPTQTFALSELNYNGCKNLFRCKNDLDHCGQSDDLTPVLAAIAQAEVLVLASPVYFTSVTGQLKLAIDRFFSFFVPDYPTAERKSRLTSGRHLVFLQTQGEPEERYFDMIGSFSASFSGLGFDHHHLVRASGVRNPGDINSDSSVLKECDVIAAHIHSNS
ncbi:MAG: flavodoxin family protein [Paracoccaceae bacterium]|nr:flavodoxin family protein [Paracoccaceae bacterium]MDG2257587.1 flavodoxin family protein [Paracoccaceae bacterium]